MASWIVHLRIADELLSRLKSLDETAFVMGNIAPDSGVPNEDWSEFRPSKKVSHFETKADNGKSFIDVDAFCDRYFNDRTISGYSIKEYSFFLGYYTHLLTDVRWVEMVCGALFTSFPIECTSDKDKLIYAAKEDWYDLDFLYLEQHPDFRAFSLYENAENFDNEFMDLFSRDAFENRRQFICRFYRSSNHGDLHRKYQYLTPDQADAFVKETSNWIIEHSLVF